MYRLLAFCLTITLFTLTSCRKDLLHWQQVQQLQSGSVRSLQQILFVNDTLGFIVGGSRFLNADILTTTDGGHSFQLRTFPEAGKALYGISRDPGNGTLYCIGYDGKMLISTDNGSNWSFRQIDYREYKSIAVTPTGNMLIAGGISFESGFVRHIDVNGQLQQLDTFNYELNKIALLPDGTGYRCGFGVIEKTTDYGRHWQQQSPQNDNFKAMHIISPQEVWTCGYNGSIYHTTNGGGDWTRKRNGNNITIPRYHLYDLLFTDELNGYAVGENGLVIYTDDGGDHWMEFDRFTDQALYSIALCANKDLLICGENGSLFRVLKK